MLDIPGKPALCAFFFFKRNRGKVDLKERGYGGGLGGVRGRETVVER